MLQNKITIIGPGVMGTTILSSLIKSGLVRKDALSVSGPDEKIVQSIHEEFGVCVYTNNALAVADVDCVIIAVKPQKFQIAANSIKGKFPNEALILSIVAGIGTEIIHQQLGVEHVIRAMPNTPARIGKGITVWYQRPAVTSDQNKLAREILQTLGQEVFVEDENYLDMATALSGTGPAYVFMFMEAMIDAGVHMGFPRRIAEELVIQTIKGSTEFYLENHEHPAKLRNDVTSPGGTSAEALYYLEKAGFRTAISRAIWAAYERSKELGSGIQHKFSEKQENKS
ncbi:MAG TPA: pyrroline-5-carboxylate reductase [Anaerolineaceae bacterium]|nr:pyrroline-5-carboxylate reductase [Anaerolineaceae bacterium]